MSFLCELAQEWLRQEESVERVVDKMCFLQSLGGMKIHLQVQFDEEDATDSGGSSSERCHQYSDG